jgi:Zn-dependent peptidase ImmA (M78 family)
MPVRRKLIRNAVEQLLSAYDISEPPVDVERLATNLGLEVRKQPAEDDLSGVLMRKTGTTAVVGVNRNHHRNRQRFTIAHEIAHFLLHPGDGLHVDKGYEVKRRDGKSSEGVDDEEKEANLFAAELLLPERFLVGDIAKLDGLDLSNDKVIAELAERYSVSAQAFGYRLAYLGFA